ncbi:calcium-activated chloride channel regulator 3A-1-like [Branchiostoma floridae x Branchiostoma japonicum]
MERRSYPVVIVLLVVVFSTRCLCSNPVTLTNNGYSTVLVAISEKVPEAENLDLIQNILTAFTDASEYLYGATKNRAYFKDVTVLIPHTWKDMPVYEDATFETFEKANIRVDLPTSHRGNRPFTRTYGKCGMIGAFTHVTPVSLGLTTAGRTLVHHWAHYRWGVFDEFATRKTNLFYQNHDGSHSPTLCTTHIRARFVDESGEECQPGDERTRVCHYEFESDTSAQASVMFHPELPTVTDFCNSDPSSPNYHNFHALGSDQNQFCNFRSTWDVISASDDFSDNNPPRTVYNTIPNFKLVYYRQYAERVSIVLDVSGSIDMGTLLPRLNQEASKYIRSFADGSMVGLITFSDTAAVDHALTELTADSHRQSLITALPSSTYGSTSIGAGIQAGLSMLKPTGQGGTIVLMTDGQENTSPMIQDVWPSVLQQKVTLVTIAIGEYADMSLEDLASQTSGLSFYDTEDASHLSEIFTAISSQDSDVIQVFAGSEDVTTSGETQTGNCRIDPTVGNSTVFQFTYVCQDMSSLPASPVTLYAPDGTEYDSTSTGLEYIIDTTAGTVQITIPGTAQDGLWRYSVTAGTRDPCLSQTVGIPNINPVIQTSVTTRPSGNQPPIECTGTLAHTVMNFREESQRVQTLYLVVQSDYACGLNADVTVYVTEPTGREVTLTMSDNGVGADMLANDGIYSAYFSGISQNGRYNVRVQVGGRVHIDNSCLAGVGENWDPFSGTTSSSSGDDGYRVEIDRMVSLGSFQVTNFIPMQDYFPPSRVTDVQIDTSTGAEDRVVLQWTAPGGDLDNGQADRYEVVVSNNITTLLQDADSAVSIQPQHCTDQTDCVISNPSGSGTQEQLIFTIPDEFSGETVYIGLRGVDEMGNMGELSNIVYYSVGNREKGPDIVITVVTAFAAVVILVTCIVGAILWKKGKLKRPPSAVRTRPTQSVRNRRPDIERGEGVVRATFNTNRVPLPPITTCTVDRSNLFQAQKDIEEDLEESKVASPERGEDVLRANMNKRSTLLPPIKTSTKDTSAMFVVQKEVEDEDLGPSEVFSQERDETKMVSTSAKQEGDQTSTQVTDHQRSVLQDDQDQELDLCSQAGHSAGRDEGTMTAGGNQMSDQKSFVHLPNVQPPPYDELFHDDQEEEINIEDEEKKKKLEEEKARLKDEEKKRLQEEEKKKEEEKRKKKRRKEERRRKKEEKRRKEAEERRKAEEEQVRRSEEERRRLEQEEKKRAQDRLGVETPILDRLEPAIHQHDSVQLEASISDYYSAGLTDDTGLLLETEELLAALQAQKELTSAMQKRDCKHLDETIIAAEHAVSMSGKTALQPIKAGRKDLLTTRRMEMKRRAAEEKRSVVQELGYQILDADKVRRLENLRHEVLQMNQSTISEIRNYNHPPQLVHQVMVATYLLLGVNESETQNWKDLQALMGKTNREGLKRKVMRHNPDRIQLKTAMRAKQLLGDLSVEQIQDISAGAATFFVWAKGVIQEVTDRHEKVLV